MNIESILKRTRKAIQKAESKITASSVHMVTVDDDIKDLVGLVIICTYSQPEIPQQIEAQS